MFLVPRTSAKILWGRVMLRYLRLGGLDGSLGLPTSSVEVTDSAERATFEHGRIRWDRASGEVTVVVR